MIFFTSWAMKPHRIFVEHLILFLKLNVTGRNLFILSIVESKFSVFV